MNLCRPGASAGGGRPGVVRDELAAGTLVERHRFPQIRETFYAIKPSRKFPNPIVRELIVKRSTAL
jgi:LysR family transcriptional activator of nhaA